MQFEFFFNIYGWRYSKEIKEIDCPLRDGL